MKMKTKKKMEKCECGGNPKIIETQMPSMWVKDATFPVYKVVCEKCGCHTIVSTDENTVIDYWNRGQRWLA